MKRYLVMVGLMLQLVAPLAKAGGASPEDSPKLLPDRIEMPGNATESDCDCCQKCKAAKKPIIPEEQPGSAIKKNGCENCCDRCGKALPSVPEDSPPDIVEKPLRR